MRTRLVAVGVIAVDQITKALAGSGLLRGPWIEPTTNTDLALGLAGTSAGVELAAGLAALWLGWQFLRRQGRGPAASLAAGLVIGGSIANLLDRALLGAVRDFIVGPMVLFNLADVALLAGVGCCLLVRMRRPARALSASDQELGTPG